MRLIDLNNVFLQQISPLSAQQNIRLQVLRTDLVHPVVSGNKWFKLQLYIQAALQNKQTCLATFGGAFSNHVVATAYACKINNLKSIGFIRGERSTTLSHTLEQAQLYGMELQFVNRSAYKNKATIMQANPLKHCCWVNEGGLGTLGAEGASEMMQWIDAACTHIICAVGTGTMMAGLIKAAQPHQIVVGISALKGYVNLLADVDALLTETEKKKQYTILHNYHFGGYGKHNQVLINWMNELYTTHQLPTDLVYTAKTMYAVFDLLNNHYFPANSNIVVIHSGGLQGNFSQPTGTFLF